MVLQILLKIPDNCIRALFENHNYEDQVKAKWESRSQSQHRDPTWISWGGVPHQRNLTSTARRNWLLFCDVHRMLQIRMQYFLL